MSKFNEYWGKAVPNQEMLSARHCSLFGDDPESGAILSNCDLDGAVVFDGEAWRELHLEAMQQAIGHR